MLFALIFIASLLIWLVAEIIMEEAFNFKQKTKRFLRIGYALLVLAFSIAVTCVTFTGFNPEGTKGERVGTVLKLDTGGIYWKTTSVTIASTQNPNGTGAVAEYTFVVSDPKVIETLEHNLDSGKLVKLSYNQWTIPPNRLGNRNEVNKVEVLLPTAQ